MQIAPGLFWVYAHVLFFLNPACMSPSIRPTLNLILLRTIRLRTVIDNSVLPVLFPHLLSPPPFFLVFLQCISPSTPWVQTLSPIYAKSIKDNKLNSYTSLKGFLWYVVWSCILSTSLLSNCVIDLLLGWASTLNLQILFSW